MKQQAFESLDQEEKELMDMEDRGELRSVSPQEFLRLKKMLMDVAKNSTSRKAKGHLKSA